ncbi:transcriptional regulator with XRE-family HTH domain [Brevibacillus aydinogluensis]|uniref:helix-turn-helix domain-containing protein n=1 Tax=Brevibacillus aydinogluensis TaxID=927786 RepID=UPI002892B03C|nr:helix-turn-helix transcriptional regulator [Brevibacillus aydinogluensis]MDT3416133.1 transcriptional regulator with XRE-family HTH domain [Brevibacillus aydinogluensis]
MDDSKKILGERLKKAREQKGLKQNRVARTLGIHNSTLAKYESGDREVDIDTLKKLAEMYEVSVDWLSGHTDDPTPPPTKKSEPDDLESIFFYELEQLSDEDKRKALDHIRYLRYLAEQENKKGK